MNATRRDTLIGGIVVAFTLASKGFAEEAPAKFLGDLSKYPDLDSWIRLDPQGHFTVFTGKAELGQGLKTALLQIAAAELGVDPADITLVTADTARSPDEGVTAGSHSMQDSGTAIANAAANVRRLIVEAAAARLDVAPDEIQIESGVARAAEASISYADLAASLDLRVTARADAPRLAAERRKFVGRPLPRVDIPAKLTGGAASLQDMRPPNLLHARVVRGPAYGTERVDADFAAAAHLPGVARIVRQGRFAAILAEREWDAIRALRHLETSSWRPASPDFQGFAQGLRSLPSQPIEVFHYPGAGAGGEAAKTLRASFSRPFLMHGSIGPSCAIAQWNDDELTVWTHSQGVGPLRGALAELLRIPPEKARCIHVEGSGCYGHNGADDVAADAALAAREVPGRAVRLQWMREQEHGFEPFGPAMTVDLEASLDANGRVRRWRTDVWSNEHNSRPVSAGGLLAGREVDPPFPPQKAKPIPMPEGGAARNSNPLYAFPDAVGTYHFIADAPFRVSALRSLGAHLNVFAIESFMDELAAEARRDPVDFRLDHLKDERARAVIRLAAERFGWSERKPTPFAGSGFAFARYKNLGAYCAVATEISVALEDGRISVKRVVAAVDSGEAINPDGIRNQIEGAIVQSLSWTTEEAAAIGPGGRRTFDWSAYPILRFPQAPETVEVHIIDRPGAPFLGTGEAGQGPMAAALGNALAAATGSRLRDLPLSPERVRESFA